MRTATRCDSAAATTLQQVRCGTFNSEETLELLRQPRTKTGYGQDCLGLNSVSHQNQQETGLHFQSGFQPEIQLNRWPRSGWIYPPNIISASTTKHTASFPSGLMSCESLLYPNGSLARFPPGYLAGGLVNCPTRLLQLISRLIRQQVSSSMSGWNSNWVADQTPGKFQLCGSKAISR